jgi:hypothetical protein
MQQQCLQGVTVGSVEDLQAMVNAIATKGQGSGRHKTLRKEIAKRAATARWGNA